MLYIPNRKKEDVMLINVIYHTKRVTDSNTDYLDIVYKDLKTGEKHVETIKNPEVDIYFTKEEHQNYNHNMAFIELDKVDKHTTKYSNVVSYIANQGGEPQKRYMDQCKESGNWGKMKELHKYPYVFGSDFDIENFTKMQWILHNDHDNPKPITKQFADIEVDGVDIDGFPPPGSCPINAITIVDETDKCVFTFLLRNPDNPLIAKFEKNIEQFVDKLHSAFDSTYGDLSYRIYMYDDELEMIRDYFRLVHTLKRDFILFWNMGFDVNFIYARLQQHFGVDPTTVFCHKDFVAQEAYYYDDVNNDDIKNKSDYFRVSSYTTYIDQMIVYSGMRKGQGEQRSSALNAVAKEELKDTKLDYNEIADIKTLPYVDYELFVMYNIKDVLLQLGIERRTGDIDSLYQRTYANATIYSKAFKPTIFLKCRMYVEFYKMGLILGNNANVKYGDYANKTKKKKKKSADGESDFDGGLVADPLLNSNTGVKIFGRKSMSIFDYAIDMDFSSMYPFIIICFNISSSTMIGKLIIDATIREVEENVERFETEDEVDEISDRGKEFMDNYTTGNLGNLGTKWLNLPGILELDKGVRSRFGIGKNIKTKLPKSDVIGKFIPELKIEL